MTSSPRAPSSTGAPLPSTTRTSVPSSAGPIEGTSQENIKRARSSAGSRGETQQAKLVYSDNPQPWMRRIRARASNSRASSTGSGADDTMMWRSVGTFSAVTRAASSMGKSDGTTLVTSTDSAEKRSEEHTSELQS